MDISRRILSTRRGCAALPDVTSDAHQTFLWVNKIAVALDGEQPFLHPARPSSQRSHPGCSEEITKEEPLVLRVYRTLVATLRPVRVCAWQLDGCETVTWRLFLEKGWLRVFQSLISSLCWSALCSLLGDRGHFSYPQDYQDFFCKFKGNIFNEFTKMYYSGFGFVFPLESKVLESLWSKTVSDTCVLVGHCF